MSPDEAAEQLGVTANKVREYCEQGLLESMDVRIGGDRVLLRISKESVRKFTPPAHDRLDLLSTGQCAAHAGQSEYTVRTAIDNQVLRAAAVSPHGARRVEPQELQRWIRQGCPRRR